jgi:hypothetical protein
MPLPDRPDFQAWFTDRNDGLVGRRHGDPTVCGTCGSAIDHALGGAECLVCLAQQYGTETAERWLVDAIAGFIRAAADPPALARMLADSISHARELAEIHAPRPAA